MSTKIYWAPVVSVISGLQLSAQKYIEKINNNAKCYLMHGKHSFTSQQNKCLLTL